MLSSDRSTPRMELRRTIKPLVDEYEGHRVIARQTVETNLAEPRLRLVGMDGTLAAQADFWKGRADTYRPGLAGRGRGSGPNTVACLRTSICAFYSQECSAGFLSDGLRIMDHACDWNCLRATRNRTTHCAARSFPSRWHVQSSMRDGSRRPRFGSCVRSQESLTITAPSDSTSSRLGVNSAKCPTFTRTCHEQFS